MFQKNDRIQRLPEFRTTGAMHLGDQILTVSSADPTSVSLEGVVGSWCPAYFSLVEPAGEVATVAGRKDDSGKLDMTLLDDMPRAMAALVEVMQWAITDKKPAPYIRGSWLGVHADRYRAAILRHNRDAGEQASMSNKPARFERDKETNLLHLAHIACSSMMALENALRELEQDNNANG